MKTKKRTGIMPAMPPVMGMGSKPMMGLPMAKPPMKRPPVMKQKGMALAGFAPGPKKAKKGKKKAPKFPF